MKDKPVTLRQWYKGMIVSSLTDSHVLRRVVRSECTRSGAASKNTIMKIFGCEIVPTPQMEDLLDRVKNLDKGIDRLIEEKRLLQRKVTDLEIQNMMYKTLWTPPEDGATYDEERDKG